ncbi:MAG: molybdopterin-dependent oxidoreductase [Bacillota bacterium]
MSEELNLTINGREMTIPSSKSDMKLLTYLRDELGLMGSKNGCGQGHCGACAVIIDGKSKRSCLWKLGRLDDSEIETIENLSKNNKLHPLQIAFLESGAVQCGFCTPGMIMSAKALLDQNQNPTEEEIKEALKRNICRCTGYKKIIEAVQLAAEYLREGKEEFKEKEVIGALGEKVIRNDGLDKVQGKPIYAADYYKDDMLHGKLYLSDKPHAKLIDIDTSAAEEMPGVVRVLTHEDIPEDGNKNFGLILDHQPYFAYDKVRYVGDPIALVLAETEEEAEAAVDKINVEYEELPAYYTPQEALADDAANIHEDGNVLSNPKVRKGDDWGEDIDEAFEKADIIVEDTYETPFIEHGYLEPESCLADYQNGRLTIWAPSQSSHAFKEDIADGLGLDDDEIRVINTTTGGAFGGREEPIGQGQCALGALLTKRPVKLVLTRKESIRMSTKRHASYARYKMGVTEDGELVAGEAEIYTDTGAYASAGMPVADRATTFTFGPHVIPNAKVDTTAVYTNNVPAGALRGFGSPQVCFTGERHMDKLARAVDMDPIEFRLKNALEVGETTLTGHVLGEGIGYKECLLKLKEAIENEDLEPSDENKEVTVGIAGGYKNVGIGNGLPEDNHARMKLNDDGTFTLYIASVDSGQGSDTVVAQVASEVLNCVYQDIEVVASDTDYIEDSGVTTASRMSFLAGNSAQGCAENLKQKILEKAQELTGISEDNLKINGKSIINKDTGEEVSSLQQVANNYSDISAYYHYEPPATQPIPDKRIPSKLSKEESMGEVHFSYCYAAHAAIVEIDKETGEFEVKKIIAVHDTGKALNPMHVEGQIEGGVSMGYGYGMSEEFYVDEEDGMPVQDTMIKLGLPTTKTMPEVESYFVEEEHPEGPFGAKGMSELPVSPVAPAINNALAKATGKEFNKIPLNTNKVELDD